MWQDKAQARRHVLPRQQSVTSVQRKVITVTVHNFFSMTLVTATQERDSQHDAAFLGPVIAESESTCTSTLRIAGKTIQFKLGTEMEVTAVSEAIYLPNARLSQSAESY